MTAPTRVLVTNDDGVSSEGLRRLALAAAGAEMEVVVAAPRTDRSGASASLGAMRSNGRVVLERRSLEDLDGVTVYAVDATPAYIALIATRGAFGDPPDLVLSGINIGHNAGQAVLHSGTVGAVLTAASRGCRGMAVSVAAETPRWGAAVATARDLLPWLASAPARTVLNVNAPGLALDDVRGRRLASLASFGAVQMTVAERGEGYVRVQITDRDAQLEPGTDAALLAEGWVTVTPLVPVCQSDAAPLGLQ